MQGNITQVIQHLKGLAPEIARKEHIRIARKGLQEVLAKSPDLPYRIIVDGRGADTEEAVKPFGVIRYVFIRIKNITGYALTTAKELSPVQSGRYKKSWIIIIDGKSYSSTNNLPENFSSFTLVNFQPYARKIHLRGARLRGVPPGIVEKVRKFTFNKFRSQVRIELRFIELSGGYVLKKDYIRGTSLHTRAGREITYPALVVTTRD